MIRTSPERVAITMIDAIILAIVLGLGLSTAMAMSWHVALRTGRSGWIDAIWSFAVGAAGVAAALAPIGSEIVPGARQMLVASMVLLWSLRLGLHIAARTRAGGDDPRYRQLREEWGARFRGRLFWFLQIQAAVALVLALSVAIAAHRPAAALDFRDGIGGLILLAALLGEGLADRQLARFRTQASGTDGICTAGLWRFSRHPNYFFEWLAWVAYAVIAIDPGGAYPAGWLALAAPALMYWLLVHVSGIPPLEAHMTRSRGARFRAYQEKVNAFWPGPSRLPARPSAG
jgi:steroid 5-alpha reductase family enzyme